MNMNIVVQLSLSTSILLCFCCELGDSLRLNRIYVPAMVAKGSSNWLYCDYDLEDKSLYSVKWYKDNLEFYRFMVSNPNARPEHKYFNQPGVNVELSLSNVSHVFLQKADLNTEGLYACEVSTDEPKFETVTADKQLKVYVLPSEKQRITAKIVNHVNGTIINVTCACGPSKPPPLLSWYINDHRVSPKDPSVNLSTLITERSTDGLITSFLILTFYLPPDANPSEESLTLTCASVVSQTSCVTFADLLLEEHGRYATSYTYQYDNNTCSPPILYGFRKSYAIGDMVEVNCTAKPRMPPAYLQWYINDRPASFSEFIVYSHEEMYEDNFISFASIYDSYAMISEEEPTNVVIGLRISLTKDHFQTVDGSLNLRCISTYPKVIHTDKSELILSRNRQSSYLFASDAAAHGAAIRQLLISASMFYALCAVYSTRD